LKRPSRLKHIPWFEIILVLAILGINGYAAFSDAYNLPNKWFTRDDAYYYFKVAQNISEGYGSTFDGINPTNGYHPLWAWVCVPIFALARFDLILPLRILVLVLAGLRAATSILLYRLLKHVIAQPVAMLAALYWGFNYYIHATIYQQGLETGLAAFCLVLFLYLLQRFERDRKIAPVSWKEPATLAVAAILVTFSRLDMIFLAGLFGLWIVFRDKPLRYLLPFDILLLAISATSAFIIRTGLPDYYQYSNMAVAMLATSLALRVPLFYFLGLYEHPKAHSILYLSRQALIATVLSTIATLAILLALTGLGVLTGSFPRSAPLIDGALSFILILATRMIISLFSLRKQVQETAPLEMLRSNWRTWLKEGGVYYGILGGALGLYMLWNKFTFGTFSPVSGQIKRWWGSFSSRVYGGSARIPQAFFGIDFESDFNAWAPVTNLVGKWNSQIGMGVVPIKHDLRYVLLFFLFLGTLLALLLINRKRAARITNHLFLMPLLSAAGFQVIQYNITGYAALKEWYWVSHITFITLIGGLLIDILTQPLRKLPVLYLSLYLAVFYFGIIAGIRFAQITKAQMTYGAVPADTPYMEAATFIETYTEPGSLVGMTGGGNVGYFIQERTIVNMDGLINSYPYFQANKARQGSDYLYDVVGLDYIFANPDFLAIQPYRGQYTGRLDIIDYYGGKAIMRFLPANAGIEPGEDSPGIISGYVDMSSAPPYLNDPVLGSSLVVVTFFNLDDGSYYYIQTSPPDHPNFQISLPPGKYQAVAYAPGVADVPYVTAGYTGEHPSCDQDLKPVTVKSNEIIEDIVIADWNWICNGSAERPAKPTDVPIP